MVILQFNKLIRNKWVWGVFAILVSAAFCFDDLFTTRGKEEMSEGEAGILAGEKIGLREFERLASEARGLGRQRDDRASTFEVNKRAWRNLAALKVAEKDGVAISDARLSETIRQMFAGQGGAFDFNRYSRYLADELGLTPKDFESYLRRQMTVGDGVMRTLLGAAAWASPLEVDQSLADITDVFTVKVASFAQDPAEAAKIKVDDAGLKKWYDANVQKLALPERIKLRYVKFDAAKPEVMAKMAVSEDEMRDYYDAVAADEYKTKDTNGVETVKAFDEVKGQIEKKLRQIAAVTFYETNLTRRAYANFAEGEDRKASRIDKIAAEEGAKVEESGWFSVSGKYVEGFMVRRESVAPGAKSFVDDIAALDPDVADFRYAVILSDRYVWLAERSALSEAHTPTFEEAKDKIGAQALRDARADAFKSEVEAVIAKGADAVLASKQVSTNLTFSVSDMRYGMFPDQYAVVQAAKGLKKGGISEFTPTGTGRAVVVVCVDRVPGDAAQSVIMRPQVRDQIASAQLRRLSDIWGDWNLERMGLTAGSAAQITEVADED
ncbi:MAG: DUF1868 domain-containing protein [Kiritimatiellae bacterium]|nr:DUF1868 domain-containing protein [Kiritimatiellia bacterium]